MDTAIIDSGGANLASLQFAFERLGEQAEVTNDPAAIGAMKAIWEAGLRIPEVIAVVGVGDIAHGDLLRVPLTTVSWSRDEEGQRAAELIVGRIESAPGGPTRRVVIPPRLVVRRSSGGD